MKKLEIVDDLVAAEARAERAAPIERFKDGATIADNAGTRYTMSKVQHRGWAVGMTLTRQDGKRQDTKGLSGRQKKRQRVKEQREAFARLRRLQGDQVLAR